MMNSVFSLLMSLYALQTNAFTISDGYAEIRSRIVNDTLFQIYNPGNANNCCFSVPQQNLAVVCPAPFQCPNFNYFVDPEGNLAVLDPFTAVHFAKSNDNGLFIMTLGFQPALSSSGTSLTDTNFITDYKVTVEGDNLVMKSFQNSTNFCFQDAGGPFAIALGNDCGNSTLRSMPIKTSKF